MTNSKKYLWRGVLVLLCSLSLCACQARFNPEACLKAFMDALCLEDYTEYAGFTGSDEADLALSRDAWLESETDRFLTAFGNLQPSNDKRTEIQQLLNSIFAKARYKVGNLAEVGDTASELQTQTSASAAQSESGNSGDSVNVTIYPMTILTDCCTDIQNYTTSFNNENAKYAYYQDSSEAYADHYYQGILTILQASLAGGMHYGDPIEIQIHFEDDDHGLKKIRSEDLTALTAAILPYPGES